MLVFFFLILMSVNMIMSKVERKDKEKEEEKRGKKYNVGIKYGDMY